MQSSFLSIQKLVIDPAVFLAVDAEDAPALLFGGEQLVLRAHKALGERMRLAHVHQRAQQGALIVSRNGKARRLGAERVHLVQQFPVLKPDRFLLVHRSIASTISPMNMVCGLTRV